MLFIFFPPATPGRLNDLLMNEIMDVKSVTYLVRMPSQPDSIVFILSPLIPSCNIHNLLKIPLFCLTSSCLSNSNSLFSVELNFISFKCSHCSNLLCFELHAMAWNSVQKCSINLKDNTMLNSLCCLIEASQCLTSFTAQNVPKWILEHG